MHFRRIDAIRETAQGLIERADARWTLERLDGAAEVLRQMVYLPNSTLLVALDGRMLVGVAVLALRRDAAVPPQYLRAW